MHTKNTEMSETPSAKAQIVSEMSDVIMSEILCEAYDTSTSPRGGDFDRLTFQRFTLQRAANNINSLILSRLAIERQKAEWFGDFIKSKSDSLELFIERIAMQDITVWILKRGDLTVQLTTAELYASPEFQKYCEKRKGKI